MVVLCSCLLRFGDGFVATAGVLSHRDSAATNSCRLFLPRRVTMRTTEPSDGAGSPRSFGTGIVTVGGDGTTHRSPRVVAARRSLVVFELVFGLVFELVFGLVFGLVF